VNERYNDITEAATSLFCIEDNSMGSAHLNYPWELIGNTTAYLDQPWEICGGNTTTEVSVENTCTLAVAGHITVRIIVQALLATLAI
jgi:hypothetical protein